MVGVKIKRFKVIEQNRETKIEVLCHLGTNLFNIASFLLKKKSKNCMIYMYMVGFDVNDIKNHSRGEQNKRIIKA